MPPHYQHTVNVLEIVEDTFDALDENDINGAHKQLKEGKQILFDRLKIIRIADKNNWITASEFKNEDLTECSDEAKNLARAIKSANNIKEYYKNKQLKRMFKTFTI